MSTSVRTADRAKIVSKLEMLIVVTIIVAVTQRYRIAEYFKTPGPTKDQRNAQIIVSVYDAGALAGVNWNLSNRDETIEDLIEGKASMPDAQNGKAFKIPHFSDPELKRASIYIGANELGALYYDGSGRQPPY